MKFHTLFIDSDVAVLAHVKIVSFHVSAALLKAIARRQDSDLGKFAMLRFITPGITSPLLSRGDS